MEKLTAKQKAFCREYLKDLNGAQAAIRAGYSERTAKEMGYENLTKPHIQAFLQPLMEARERRTEIDADRVIKELAKIGLANNEELGAWETAKVSDKISALDKIGRHLGMWNDKLKVEGDLSDLNPAQLKARAAALLEKADSDEEK